MVKKVKRFIVFVLFSFFYSLLAGKTAEAAKVVLVPQTNDSKLKYNDIDQAETAESIANAVAGDIGYL